MKTCPVCESVAFDDAVQCFGCLHEFADDDPIVASEREATPSGMPRMESLPEFLIKFTPLIEPSGGVTWSCAVEEPVACRGAVT